MDSERADRFKQELARARSYLEYGSGATTVLADRAGIEAVSVENDRFYAKAVAAELDGDRVRQIVVSTGLTREWGFALFPTIRKARAYVDAPFPSEQFPDFILVDGRYRLACALACARRANLAGQSATLMFDDYVLRTEYHSVEDYLGVPELAGRAAIFRIGSRSVPLPAIEEALRDQR